MINWLGFYRTWDGYGRFNNHLVCALRKMGVDVKVLTQDHVSMPEWLHEQEGIDWDNLTITCLSVCDLLKIPGRHIAYTMMESSRLSQADVQHLNTVGVERVIVPTRDIADNFVKSGVMLPISVIPGGTDPEEFPVRDDRESDIYTFLTINDRGFRKGFEEVWQAFYAVFGGKTTGKKDVRLIAKSIPKGNRDNVAESMVTAQGADPRIKYQINVQEDAYSLYAQADCLALPSRFEGWGMPHREAACMGLPVIATAYSGLNDGYTDQWALTVPGDVSQIVSHNSEYGEWMLPDIASVADRMLWCYENREEAAKFGRKAAQWIRENQTWQHTAEKLMGVISCL